jgi:hypothetical protein
MINRRLFLVLMVGAILQLFSPVVPSLQAKSNDMELEVQLIWATNDATSPDRDHKPVEEELSKKLGKAFPKWKNFFEVCRKTASIADGATDKLSMSKQCDLELKNLGDGRVEVKQFGNKKLVLKQTEPMSVGHISILGGDVAENNTAWLIVIKRVEKKKK